MRPTRVQNLHHHLDYFGIHGRRIRPDRFSANLKKLAIAAFLRTLTPKHRPEVVELLHAGTLIQTVLDVGANDGGGVLRAQRKRAAVTVRRTYTFPS